MKNQQIGVFGGSFNPLHKAHFELVKKLVELKRFEKILLLPSYQNPLKSKESFFSAEVRLECLKQEFKNLPNLHIETFELVQKRAVYTFETLRHLKHSHVNSSFIIIIGSDNYKNFAKWKNHHAILELASLLVVSRKGEELADSEKTTFPAIFVEMDLPDFSSSMIRELFIKGKDISSFVPPQTNLILKNLRK